MAAPLNSETLEFGVGGLPLVLAQGLNTNQAVNFSGFQVDTSGNVSSPGTITATGGNAAAGGFTSSPRCLYVGNADITSLTQGTDTAITTTSTYIGEIFIPANVTVTGVGVLMGSVAGNGNLSVALANSSGVVVASSATTTTSGTSTTITKVSFSATYAAVGPATYYVLVQGGNASDKLRLQAAGTYGATIKTSETYGTFTTITAPTTFTAANSPIAALF